MEKENLDSGYVAYGFYLMIQCIISKYQNGREVETINFQESRKYSGIYEATFSNNKGSASLFPLPSPFPVDGEITHYLFSPKSS